MRSRERTSAVSSSLTPAPTPESPESRSPSANSRIREIRWSTARLRKNASSNAQATASAHIANHAGQLRSPERGSSQASATSPKAAARKLDQNNLQKTALRKLGCTVLMLPPGAFFISGNCDSTVVNVFVIVL